MPPPPPLHNSELSNEKQLLWPPQWTVKNRPLLIPPPRPPSLRLIPPTPPTSPLALAKALYCRCSRFRPSAVVFQEDSFGRPHRNLSPDNYLSTALMPSSSCASVRKSTGRRRFLDKETIWGPVWFGEHGGHREGDDPELCYPYAPG